MNIDKNILEVPIEDIIPNRFQPRLSFNEEGINELAESIKQHGIIQPLVVRKLGDKYEIIAGERRYKASTMAGLTKVPVIISDIDDNKSAEVALVENIQRRNLTAIEEAKSYKNLLDRGYMTQEQLANKMGVSQSAIANKLRLLNLDEEVQDALLNEKISERHARALLVLDDKEEQKKWLKRIMEERLTVRQLDMELKKREENGGIEDEGIPLVNINPNLDEIVSHAEDIHVERAPHDVASMLIPEGGIKIEEPKEEPPKSSNKFFNFLEDEQANMNVIEPDEILNTFTSIPVLESVTEENLEAPSKEVEIEKEISPSVPTLDEILNPSLPTEEPKPIENANNNLETLDILEDLNNSTVENITSETQEEPVVVEEIEPIVTEPIMPNVFEPSIFPEVMEQPEQKEKTETPIQENSSTPISETVLNTPILEPIQEDPISIPTPEKSQTIPVMEETPIIEEPVQVSPITQTIENQIIEEQPILEPVIEDTKNEEEIKPFKSIFFNSEDDEDESESNQVVSPVISNTIEEVKPIIEEPLVDPLDRIVTLEPGYQERQEELAGTDLKTAINVVRDTISDLEKRGFVVECEEADLEDIYHITIKIDKNNK